MGVKGSWPRGKSSSFCVKNCINRDQKCDSCWKFDQFVDKNDKDMGDSDEYLARIR